MTCCYHPVAMARYRPPGERARGGHTGPVPEPLIRSRPTPVSAPHTGAAVVTHRAAVLGMPIEHSLSPVLHTAAYAELGLSGWDYGRYAVDEAGLPGFVAGLGPEWVGLSLTMPLKRVALEVADEVTPDTAAIGAANTLVRRDAGWLATNTDVVGIEQALRAVGVTAVECAVVVGGGGTAQAALAALRRLGETAPTVLVRDPARAGALRDTAERLGVTPRIVGRFPSTPLPPADVVISTVPAGAADVLADVVWDPAAVLLDVIYAPWPTAPAAAAAAAGCRVAGGLEVLLHQAVGQVELMTGLPGPTEAMAAALAAAAGERRP
jgi:shikimate dehydrogenase